MNWTRIILSAIAAIMLFALAALRGAWELLVLILSEIAHIAIRTGDRLRS